MCREYFVLRAADDLFKGCAWCVVLVLGLGVLCATFPQQAEYLFGPLEHEPAPVVQPEPEPTATTLPPAPAPRPSPGR